MPKQKEGYENAMGSVFDFIFTESQKPPNKVKPVKVTGVDGSSEMVDAITAVLENPLLFVNKTTMESFKGAVDVDLAAFSVGKRGTDNIKFNLQDIPTLLKDPGKYIDAQFTKIEGIRKQQRAAWAGEEMKGILGYMWARANGLDQETQEAMMGAGRVGTRTAADTAGMSIRTERLARKHFGPGSQDLTLQDFQNRFGSVLSDQEVRERWKKYDGYKKAYRGAQLNIGKGGIEERKALGQIRDLHFERDLFTLLERTDLSEKAIEARNRGDDIKANQYEKAGNYIDNIYDPQRAKVYKQKQQELVNKYSNDIQALRRSSDPNKSVKIKQLEHEMGRVKGDLRMSNLESFAANLGKYEGMYYSAKELVLDGQLLPNIINGKFFSKKFNKIEWLQPSIEDAKVTLKIVKDKQGKDREIVSEFHAPKVGTSKFQQEYFDKMNTVYYLSPAAWAKTLIDGEGFAFLAGRNQEKFKKMIEGEIKGFDFNTFLKEALKGEDKYIKGLGAKISARQMEMIDKFLKKNESLSNLAHTFGTISRVRDKLKNLLEEKVLRHVRAAVGKVLLVGIKSKVAVALVNEWVLKGGLQTLVQGISTAIASAIGVAGTPIAGAIAFLVSEIAYRVAKPVMKLAAYSAKIGLEVFFFFIAGLVAMVMFLLMTGGPLLGVHSHVAPFEVVECAVPPEEMMDPGDISGSPVGKEDQIGYLLGGDGQAIFDEVLAMFGLSGYSFGTMDDASFSSQYSSWAWCVATGGGVVCNSSKVYSAGLSYFQGLMVHEVTHLAQYRNGGLAGNSVGMEVGAEIISGNYGGYKFRTINGTQSGTQIRDAMLAKGYSQQAIEDWSKGIRNSESSKVGSEIAKYVSGFAN